MAGGFRGMAVGGGRPGGGGGLWAARPAPPPAGWWWTTGGQDRRRGRAVEANRKEAEGLGSSSGEPDAAYEDEVVDDVVEAQEVGNPVEAETAPGMGRLAQGVRVEVQLRGLPRPSPRLLPLGGLPQLRQPAQQPQPRRHAPLGTPLLGWRRRS